MNQPATIENPFGKQVQAASSGSALVATESERAIQEVQAAMVIAKRFPRNTMEAMDRIINACTRESLAAGALYSYPRGGQEITGPSIRLAEAMAQEWGNIQFGIRELSSENGASTVEAFAWDVETNTRQVKVFQVPHTRHTRQGTKRLTDPRDIYELVANQGARRLRACILGVIPGDVTEAAVRQCELTQENTIEVTPESVKKMVEYFGKFGVTKELIEKRLGKHLEAINAPQMLNLKKIAQSLNDGMSKPSDWFDLDEVVETEKPKTSDLNIATAGRQAEVLEGDASDDGLPPASNEERAAPAADLTYAMVAEALNEADEPESLAAASALMAQFLAADGNEEFEDELKKLQTNRRRVVTRKQNQAESD